MELKPAAVPNPATRSIDGSKRCEAEAHTSKVVRSFVDRSNSEFVGVTAGNNEVKHSINGIVRVGKVGGVEEPGIVEESLANVEVVDSARKRVKSNDAVHAILGDSIVGNGLEVGLLVSVVELRARDINPGGVGGRDSEDKLATTRDWNAQVEKSHLRVFTPTLASLSMVEVLRKDA